MDVVANMFTAIKNGQKVEKKEIIIPFSKLKENIAKILKEEGYLINFKKIKKQKKVFLRLILKYQNGKPVIFEIKRISKPGRRVYINKKTITPVLGGLGIAVLSTSQGVMTAKNAKKLGVGGEIICQIW